MVQGSGVLKGKKKIEKPKAANRHGKTPRTRKGKFSKPPRKASKRREWEADRQIAKIRVEKGLATAQAQAQGAGERIRIGLPPVLAGSAKKKPVKTGVEAMVEG